MDPVQYFLAMMETHNISCFEARQITCQKFNLTFGWFDQHLIDARRTATVLLVKTEAPAKAFGV